MQTLTLTALAMVCSDATAAEAPHSFEAKVVKIADGETITVRPDKTQHKIGRAGIDAPEKGQAYET